MKKKSIKLNIGASPIWVADNWHILDHKIKNNDEYKIAGDAECIDLPDKSCSVVFCSHVFEHIPHIKLPKILSEINRVLEKDGILRILTPDLEKVSTAYVKKDKNFFKKALKEDENIRTDLGMGGMLMNFIVSPGQDTVLLDRNLKNFISGYAHLYSYDYKMLKILLKKAGFKSRKANFNDSVIDELRIPLHVKGLAKKWQNFNKKFYKKNKLIHVYKNGKYHINFRTTGFDRDPLTSLIVESKKVLDVNKEKLIDSINNSKKNYNRYAYSLLKNKIFNKILKNKKIIFSKNRII
jgi:SAM-dependent methyltransferase